ncbi:Kelch protein 20 [Trichostrongylus colubriformis]|uniref:Kelch protein 20 n=1 Tax=Trichostrongylus colubriformis TaxID=6319 RepID=A0AAN8GCG5_TRICO
MKDKKNVFKLEDSSGHSRLVLNQLAAFRDDARLCDVILIAKGTRINAHRVVLAACSDYFLAMFTNQMAESRSREIELADIETPALDALVNFCYSGIIQITELSVMSILHAANLLQLDKVKELCCEFLKEELDPSNCLAIGALADMYSCQELLCCANECSLNKFQQLVATEEFTSLPFGQLLELISSEELRVVSEEQVFQAVAKWVNFDLTARKQFLPQLLEQVRLPLCHPKFLVDTVSEDALVMEDVACRRLLDEAKNYQLLQLSTPIRPAMQGLRTRPRNSDKFSEVLYVVGGLCKRAALDSVERFVNEEAKPSWQSVASMTKKRGALGVAVLDNFLYAVGGKDEEEIHSSIERYDPTTNQWSNDVAPMLTRRVDFGLATFDGFICTVGGYDGSNYLDSVECYDGRRNQWTSVAPMRSCRRKLAVAVLNGCLYVVGGFDGNAYLNIVERLDPRVVEKYDPLTNEWTAVAAMNCKRSAVGLAVVNERMYAVGGNDGDCSQNTVEVFDPEANQWNLHDSMNDRRCAAALGVIRMA